MGAIPNHPSKGWSNDLYTTTSHTSQSVRFRFSSTLTRFLSSLKVFVNSLYVYSQMMYNIKIAIFGKERLAGEPPECFFVSSRLFRLMTVLTMWPLVYIQKINRSRIVFFFAGEMAARGFHGAFSDNARLAVGGRTVSTDDEKKTVPVIVYGLSARRRDAKKHHSLDALSGVGGSIGGLIKI